MLKLALAEGFSSRLASGGKGMLITFSGIDGAGKSTIVNILLSDLRKNGCQVRSIHCRYKPFIIKPLTRVLKGLSMSEETVPRREVYMLRETKKRFFRSSLVHLLYALFVIVDHIVQVKIKVSPSLRRGEIVVCDEYLVDTIAKDIAMEPKYFRRASLILAWTLYRMIPKPDVAFFVSVDPNIAFNRKDDVPSVKHLTNLSKVYLALASLYDLKVLDGSMDLDSLGKSILGSVSCQVNR